MWCSIKYFLSKLLTVYFYFSTVVISFYPFWFGIEFLNNNYPSVTVFFQSYAIWLLPPSFIGIIIKAIFDANIHRKYIKEKEKNGKLESDIVELSEALKDLSNDVLRDFFREKLDADNGGTVTRISLYVSNNQGLYCLSRYSKNQTC